MPRLSPPGSSKTPKLSALWNKVTHDDSPLPSLDLYSDVPEGSVRLSSDQKSEEDRKWSDFFLPNQVPEKMGGFFRDLPKGSSSPADDVQIAGGKAAGNLNISNKTPRNPAQKWRHPAKRVEPVKKIQNTYDQRAVVFILPRKTPEQLPPPLILPRTPPEIAESVLAEPFDQISSTKSQVCRDVLEAHLKKLQHPYDRPLRDSERGVLEHRETEVYFNIEKDFATFIDAESYEAGDAHNLCSECPFEIEFGRLRKDDRSYNLEDDRFYNMATEYYPKLEAAIHTKQEARRYHESTGIHDMSAESLFDCEFALVCPDAAKLGREAVQAYGTDLERPIEPDLSMCWKDDAQWEFEGGLIHGRQPQKGPGLGFGLRKRPLNEVLLDQAILKRDMLEWQQRMSADARRLRNGRHHCMKTRMVTRDPILTEIANLNEILAGYLEDGISETELKHICLNDNYPINNIVEWPGQRVLA